MKKYTIILIFLSLFVFSCSKDVSLDGVDIKTSSGLNISTEDGAIEMNQNGVEITSGENEVSVGSDGMIVSDGETNIEADSGGMEIKANEGTIKMDENGMTSNIEGVGEMSITNTGTKIGDINISSGDVAEDFIENVIGNEMDNLKMDSEIDNETME